MFTVTTVLMIPPTLSLSSPSVPELDISVPARSGDLAGLMWVPQHLDTNIVVSLPLGQQLGGLPVPNIDLPSNGLRVRMIGNVAAKYLQPTFPSPSPLAR